VVRDPRSLARTFPANKVIDRILSAKRDGAQLREGERNILWLDLKHGLELSTDYCVPLRSILALDACFVGSHGVWHAFYGRVGDPLFVERTVLDFPVPRRTYDQLRNGWFRTVPHASAAVLSVLDGVLVWENPWAALPLGTAVRSWLLTLGELRPEFSWFDDDADTLELRVEAERRRIAWIAENSGDAHAT
jgi:hypothetical protein